MLEIECKSFFIIVVWQMEYYGEQWLGYLSINQDQDRYSTVFMETVNTKNEMRIVWVISEYL